MTRRRWHAAFFDIIRLELEEFGSSLDFLYEYQVGIDPKKIDIVVKRRDDIAVTKNIGAILNKYSIIEYKSYNITLSLSEYNKAHGRLRFYAAEKKIFSVDLSLIFFSYNYPAKLFSELQLEGKEICEINNGIYSIKGEGYDTYVVVTKHLSEEDNYWLVNIHKELSATEIDQLITEIEKRKLLSIDNSLLELIILNNKKTFQELIMRESLKTLLEQYGFVHQDKINKIIDDKERILKEKDVEFERILKENERRILREKDAEKDAEKEEIARNLTLLGIDYKKIADVTGLTVNKVKRLKI
jgi:predicted aspartyl protease